MLILWKRSDDDVVSMYYMMMCAYSDAVMFPHLPTLCVVTLMECGGWACPILPSPLPFTVTATVAGSGWAYPTPHCPHPGTPQ